MKWLGAIITLAAVMPLSWWLQHSPRETSKFWMLMGFLPFVQGPLHLFMDLSFWPEWPGYVTGADFYVLDALAIALYLSLSAAPRPLPFRLSMAFYFLAVLLSALQAEMPIAALFYAWQLARMFLIYAVVTKASGTDPRVTTALLQGMAAGLLMEAGIAIWQQFVEGAVQPNGTFSHQNLLGMLSHLIVFPFFAVFLVKRRIWLPAAVMLAGIVIEVLTKSRATLGLAGFGFATVFLLSALRQFTSRKMIILLIGVAMLTIIIPLALSSLGQRKQFNSEDSSDNVRTAYTMAAKMIISDYPFGVGANHFSLIGSIGGYYQKAGVPAISGARTGFVHNVYLLVAGETGYLGLIAFMVLLLGPLIVAFRCGLVNRRDIRGDLLLGLGVGLLTVYIHCLFEWDFLFVQYQYIFALELGLVAGLAEQLGYWRRPKTLGARLGTGTLSIRSSGNRQKLSRRILK